MASSFWKKLVSGLQRAQQVLDMLEANGVDVDRLIAISNAQGPQGKLIKSVLTGAIGFEELSPDNLSELKVLAPAKTSKRGKTSSKKSAS